MSRGRVVADAALRRSAARRAEPVPRPAVARERAVRVRVVRGPGRPPGQSQAPVLRERIVAEASRLYADGGNAGVSLGVLADRVGLNKATLFHYFENKEALVYAIFESLGERLEAATRGLFDEPPASHAERLDRIIEALVDFYGAQPVNARILAHGLLETDRVVPTGGGDGMPVFARFVQRFARFMADGAATGEFHPDRPLGAILSIGGAILFELMLPEVGRQLYRDVSFEARKRELVDLIRRAVVRAPQPAHPARRARSTPHGDARRRRR
jgi:AcrR family transcriptional regulator